MERSVVVAVPEGLHARPAALFAARAAGAAGAPTIARPGETPVSAASIVSVMGLGIRAGDTVVLRTADESDEARAVLDSLAEFLTARA